MARVVGTIEILSPVLASSHFSRTGSLREQLEGTFVRLQRDNKGRCMVWYTKRLERGRAVNLCGYRRKNVGKRVSLLLG